MRTMELTAANQDLEAFGYSVSHDLRSPLRLISGFAKILDRNLAGRLDDDERTLFDEIMKNTSRMSDLIDELLKFSRIGRIEVVKNDTDMNNLVNDIITVEKFRETFPRAQITIRALENVPCDAGLIGQVWVNLISNALKYSCKKEEPLVEITCSENEGMLVYSVKDNGAGFDMQYVHKLFNPFQRLHLADDFEGVGVGLSLASRIISKHGGKIRAEGKVNEGAVFHFELPRG